MKFEGTRPSGIDPDIDVFKFTIGRQEIRLLLGALIKSERNLPQLFELTPIGNRLKNMIRILKEGLEHADKNCSIDSNDKMVKNE